MDEFTKRLIHLIHSKHIGWKTVLNLLKIDPMLNDLYKEKPYPSILPQPHTFLIGIRNIPIDNLLSEYFSRKIHLITIFDDAYPEQLKTIYQPPWVLFAKGDISLLKYRRSLAVVGSRDATSYGDRKSTRLNSSHH